MKTITTLLLCLYTIVAFGQKESEVLIYDFKKRSDFKEAKVTGNATLKKNVGGLNVKAPANEEVTIKLSHNFDFHDWIYISFVMKNESKHRQKFETIIEGKLTHAHGAKPHPIKGIGWMEPNEVRTFDCLLMPDHSTRERNYPDLSRDFKDMPGFPQGVSFTNSFDLKHTKSITFVIPKTPEGANITFGSVYLKRDAIPLAYTKDQHDFFPFIDVYGQYKYSEWDGKIKKDNQFAKDIEKENIDLEAHKGSEEWGKYGSYTESKSFKATGHFRTEKVNETWWIIDPEGKVFWSSGVNGAGHLEATTKIEGRNQYFEYVPDHDDPDFGEFWNEDGTYNFGQANLKRKYGKFDADTYSKRSIQRMKSWGLNTMGANSKEEWDHIEEAFRLPYTISVSTFNGAEMLTNFPDVFHPNWDNYVMDEFEKKAAKAKSDAYFMGWFVDENLTMYTPVEFADLVIMNGASSFAKAEYLKMLEAKGETLHSFNKKTHSHFKKWKEVMSSTKEIDLSAFKAENAEFYDRALELYFSTIRNTIDKVSPNKMYLGCRFNDDEHTNKHTVEVAAKYVDIISFNHYDDDVDSEDFMKIINDIDKPYLISEFNFGTLDKGKLYTGVCTASDQRNRGEKYEHYVNSALHAKKCVGVHWNLWGDATTVGTIEQTFKANSGFLTETDQPYYELIEYVRKVNYEMYSNRYKRLGDKQLK
ncbi:hypothetical protein [Flammeovirga sp. SubArs3]|uniref:hypothetical protein n=1 Tax=Flammeovirga sp. SubArs3 TaxID=2995316 RepID=UPI00248BBA6D|nr:hypothetical protein [Flammeovirga sp. SubArs3]